VRTDTSHESSAERSLASEAALARRTSIAGSVGSLVVHGTIVALVYASGQTPDYGFEFTVPAELELGLTEAVAVEASPPPSPPPTPEPEPLAGAGAGQGAMDAGVPASDGSIGDGGVPSDAPRRRRRDAALDPDAGELVASGEGESSSPVAFLPAGGQIALRLDLDHVRASPVRADVERLLGAIPDWQALLGTSGVEPVRDLSRVLVATPNLQRSSLVVAGRLADGAPAPSVIVEQLVTAGGGTVAWEEQDGVPTTEWPNPDATPRRVAIVGDRHFVIARGEDLPRVLAIAASRAESERPGEPPRTSPADALLALPDGAAITLEIEGARAYVRQSPCRVPTRLAARADEVDGMVHVSLHAVFDSEDESTEAASCFETLRARALSNPIVSFMGFGGPLGELEIDTDGASLDATTRLSYSHVRSALRYAQGMFRRSAPPPTGASGPPIVTPVPPPGVTPVPPPPGITPVPPPPVPPPSSVTPVPPPPAPPAR
jgi:hypothetical protein